MQPDNHRGRPTQIRHERESPSRQPARKGSAVNGEFRGGVLDVPSRTRARRKKPAPKLAPADQDHVEWIIKANVRHSCLWCKRFLCQGHRVIFLSATEFSIESRDRERSSQGNWYHVSTAPVEYCGCDGFNFRKGCWHLDLGRLLAQAIDRFIAKFFASGRREVVH